MPALPDRTKILVVEDEATQRRLLSRQLEKQGFGVFEAENGRQGLQCCLENPNLRLVITDLMMPEMDGFEFIQAVREQETRYTYIIVLTALEEKDSIVRALSLGADDYLAKPVFQDELTLRLAGAERLLKQEGHDQLVFGLAQLAGSRSGETGFHLHRVRQYSLILGLDLMDSQPELGLTRGLAEEIANVSPLHDIGKVGIPDNILHKPGRLTPEEFEVMKTHTVIGADLLREIYDQAGSRYLLIAWQITRFHHERWDGTGYPDGLRGGDIPLAARIIALADVFDALVSRRCYKTPFPYPEAREIILSQQGRHFDPMLVASFARTEEQWLAVADHYRENNDEPDIPALERR